MKKMKINSVLLNVKEVKETTDIKKVAHLLSTGEWIAIGATTSKPPLFSLGRVEKTIYQSWKSPL